MVPRSAVLFFWPSDRWTWSRNCNFAPTAAPGHHLFHLQWLLSLKMPRFVLFWLSCSRLRSAAVGPSSLSLPINPGWEPHRIESNSYGRHTTRTEDQKNRKTKTWRQLGKKQLCETLGKKQKEKKRSVDPAWSTSRYSCSHPTILRKKRFELFHPF